jgi:xanthine dehydrogenase YagS FAD-binding subunit
VRNTATVGGNLCQKPRCWYYRSQDFDCLKKGGPTCYAQHGDNRYHAIFGASACHIVHPSNIAVPLLGQGASLRLVRSQHGKRVERTVSLDEFFRVPISPRDDENVLGRGELVREVLVPLKGAGKRAAYIEAREKQSFDWPLVSCAVNLNEPSKPRVVLGAVAPIPWRLEKVEKLIAGRQLSDGVVERAKNVAMDGALPMSHNGYKLRLVGALVEQALRQASAG